MYEQYFLYSSTAAPLSDFNWWTGWREQKEEAKPMEHQITFRKARSLHMLHLSQSEPWVSETSLRATFFCRLPLASRSRKEVWTHSTSKEGESTCIAARPRARLPPSRDVCQERRLRYVGHSGIYRSPSTQQPSRSVCSFARC